MTHPHRRHRRFRRCRRRRPRHARATATGSRRRRRPASRSIACRPIGIQRATSAATSVIDFETRGRKSIATRCPTALPRLWASRSASPTRPRSTQLCSTDIITVLLRARASDRRELRPGQVPAGQAGQRQAPLKSTEAAGAPRPPLLARASRTAPVAQLDRALPSEGRGHRFESCRVRHAVRKGGDHFGLRCRLLIKWRFSAAFTKLTAIAEARDDIVGTISRKFSPQSPGREIRVFYVTARDSFWADS